MSSRVFVDTESQHFGDTQSQGFVHIYSSAPSRLSVAGEHLRHSRLTLLKLSIVFGMLSFPLFRRVHDLHSPDRVRGNISLPAVDRDHRQRHLHPLIVDLVVGPSDLDD